MGCRRRSRKVSAHRPKGEGIAMFSRIAGTGSYLPEKILTNADLVHLVDTSDEWIRSRTGIERRHVVVPGETTRIWPSTPPAAR